MGLLIVSATVIPSVIITKTVRKAGESHEAAARSLGVEAAKVLNPIKVKWPYW